MRGELWASPVLHSLERQILQGHASALTKAGLATCLHTPLGEMLFSTRQNAGPGSFCLAALRACTHLEKILSNDSGVLLYVSYSFELITSLQCLGLLVWEHLNLMTIWKVKQHFEVSQVIHFFPFQTQGFRGGGMMPDWVSSGINNLFGGLCRLLLWGGGGERSVVECLCRPKPWLMGGQL